ncbi:MAG: hypothetical protein KAT41_07465, partial [Candidatus Marinimicrobia bacterium]|nr:hypothetical protein [Candidatus Neomarinimicrobiota bacterium]
CPDRSQFIIKKVEDNINPNVKNGIVIFLTFVLNIKDKGRRKRAVAISAISGRKYLMLRILSMG